MVKVYHLSIRRYSYSAIWQTRKELKVYNQFLISSCACLSDIILYTSQTQNTSLFTDLDNTHLLLLLTAVEYNVIKVLLYPDTLAN